MQYRRVKASDLAQVNRLVTHYYPAWTGAEINSRDIAFGAFGEHGVCHGVVWVGLMKKNKLGYIDGFITDPEMPRKGLGRELARSALEACQKLGVEKVIGVIATDEFHDRSAINALRLGMGAKSLPHTVVFGELKNMGKGE